MIFPKLILGLNIKVYLLYNIIMSTSLIAIDFKRPRTFMQVLDYYYAIRTACQDYTANEVIDVVILYKLQNDLEDAMHAVKFYHRT